MCLKMKNVQVTELFLSLLHRYNVAWHKFDLQTPSHDQRKCKRIKWKKIFSCICVARVNQALMSSISIYSSSSSDWKIQACKRRCSSWSTDRETITIWPLPFQTNSLKSTINSMFLGFFSRCFFPRISNKLHLMLCPARVTNSGPAFQFSPGVLPLATAQVKRPSNACFDFLSNISSITIFLFLFDFCMQLKWDAISGHPQERNRIPTYYSKLQNSHINPRGIYWKISIFSIFA